MIFTVIVNSGPLSQGSRSALKFIAAALSAGHQIYRVFFYQDGVNIANDFMVTPQDESNILSQWVKLKHDYQLELFVCVAAALRRGIINKQEANRYKKTGANLNECFELSGLGQMVDATVNSDRVVSF